MTIPEYIAEVDKLYRSGRATEHSYRPALQALLTDLSAGITVTNEPTRIDCGAPDYILTRRSIPVGYVEAKDVGTDLDHKSHREQFDRYRKSLANLIITDYLQFRFFREGEPTLTVRIGQLEGGKVKPLPAHFDEFARLIADFTAWQGQTITHAGKLADMMAGKARLLADVIEKAVSSDEQTQANTELKDQLQAFKNILIHDITPRAFADLYAQTIAYGMFAARQRDTTLEDFSRQEAAHLIPKSNPFLRKLFNSISGPDLDDRIVWIVDDLVEIFRATDITALLKGFGKKTGREDAFVHFYEDFLAAYDPKLRKSRGVWYTPDAVVKFIVRAVDDILRTEFGLPMGLADSSTVEIEVDTDITDNRTTSGRRRQRRKVHRVQVLDPATGTGTFLAEVVRHVHAQFEGQEGMWPQYVEQHLIPRLNGFELLMASYAMAHLKLDLVLRETGYDMGQPHGTPNQNARAVRPSAAEARPSVAEAQQRLRVFLTNSLEEAHPDTGTLFASWLSQEANEANAVKRDTPVMVVLGNPPYSIISSNLSEKQRAMVERYKYIDGERIKEKGALQMEKNLNDDYVKFIALGEHLINATGEGMLAYINNNNYLDAPTLRGMRANLLKSFNSLYIIDLKGNSKKKDRTPDGRKDENVFDIQQGVCINIHIKNPNQRKARVRYISIQGDREMKYALLEEGRIGTLQWRELRVKPPKYELIPRDYEKLDKYEKGIRVTDLFPRSGTGIITARDRMVIDTAAEAIAWRVAYFRDSQETDEVLCKALDISLKKGWDIGRARQRIKQVHDIHSLIQPILYRPFDLRKVFYHDSLLWSPVKHVMDNFFGHENVGLITARSNKSPRADHVFISKHMTETKCGESTTQSILIPLYLYPDATKQTSALTQSVQPNLDLAMVQQMAEGIGLHYRFDPEDLWAHGQGDTLTPLDVLDYCYAVLHSPAYRGKFKEFLKSDFPRIPFPKDLAGQGDHAAQFRSLVQLGAQLRKTHLLEDPAVDRFITRYPEPGDNTVSRKLTAASPGWEATGKGLGRVWINDDQYFADVPETAWNFYIGGYQPAQKWLKDRRDRQLTFDDIRHYQRIIVALNETAKLMEEVDKVGVV